MYNDDSARGRLRQYCIWGGIFIAGTVLLVLRISHEGVWYDESYTIAAVQNSFYDLIGMISRDSHPPLYFLVLKVWTLIFGTSVTAFRLFSALGMFVSASLGYTHVRKLVSERAGMIYSILVFITPITIFHGQDIRMYSWCGALVTAAFLYIMEYWLNRKKTASWIAGGVCALGASLIHYYGLLAVTILYGLLFLYSLFAERGEIKRIVISGLALLLVYSPVIAVLVWQTARISKGFWILPLKLFQALSLVTYYYGYKFDMLIPATRNIAALFALLCIGYGIYRSLSEKKRNALPAILAILVFFLTILAGFILSIIFRPILVGRYLTAVMGLFIFAVALGMDTVRFPQIPVFVYFMLTVSVLFGIYAWDFNGPMKDVYNEMKDQVGKDDVFLHGSEHTMGTFYYYFPENRHYLYIPEGHNPYSNYEVFKRHGAYGGDITPYLKEQQNTIWLTNRSGDPTKLPLVDIIKNPHWNRDGQTRRFNKPKSWFVVELTKCVYSQEASAAQAPQIGTFTITVEGLRGDGPLMWGLFDRGPLGPGNTCDQGMSESIENGSTTVTLRDLMYGRYAFFCWQDENGNMQPDFESEGIAQFVPNQPDNSDFQQLSIELNGDKAHYELTLEYPE